MGAEAVPGVVQAHQAEVGTVGHEARGQQVEAACIVQPAVQCQPCPCVLCVLVRGMWPDTASQEAPGDPHTQLSAQRTAHSRHSDVRNVHGNTEQTEGDNRRQDTYNKGFRCLNIQNFNWNT